MHHDPVPGAFQETVNALDALVAPFRIELRGTYKQLVHTQRIAAVLANQIIRCHNVALGLGHLLGFSALAGVRDHSLIEQPRKRLFEAHGANIEKEHRVKPRIEQMQDRVLHAANVHVDREPFLALFRNQRVRGMRRGIAEEVPGRTCPLRHGVGFAARRPSAFRTFHVHPFLDRRQRGFTSSSWQVALDVGQRDRQIAFVHRHKAACRAPHDRNRFSPITLA